MGELRGQGMHIGGVGMRRWGDLGVGEVRGDRE